MNLAAFAFAFFLLASAFPASAQPFAERSLAVVASGKVKDAAAAAWHTAQKLSSVALGLIGVNYRYGGDRPDTGLDCSGLVRYVFQHVTGIVLPRTAKEMSRVGEHVALDDLMPGDLVFFDTRRFAFSHVGIYLGDNRFVHAPSRGRDVQVATIDKHYWQQRFNGARRLVRELPNFMSAPLGEAWAAPLGEAWAAPLGEAWAAPLGEAWAAPLGEAWAAPLGEAVATVADAADIMP